MSLDSQLLAIRDGHGIRPSLKIFLFTITRRPSQFRTDPNIYISGRTVPRSLPIPSPLKSTGGRGLHNLHQNGLQWSDWRHGLETQSVTSPYATIFLRMALQYTRVFRNPEGRIFNTIKKKEYIKLCWYAFKPGFEGGYIMKWSIWYSTDKNTLNTATWHCELKTWSWYECVSSGVYLPSSRPAALLSIEPLFGQY